MAAQDNRGLDEHQESKTQGSGRPVQDFSFFCEGDIEPRLNKRINTLIDGTRDHIVYLDDDFYVEWAYIRFPRGLPKGLEGIANQLPNGFDNIANQIGHLETLSITQLSKIQREPFARLLGEAMARVLGGDKEDEGRAVLERAEAYLQARGLENARRWYLERACAITAAALIIGAILLGVRGRINSPVLVQVVELAIGTTIGSLGALLSIASRTEALHVDPVAGQEIHRFEAAIRVAVGMGGAFFVALCIKANLFLGELRLWPHPLIVLLIACIVAGASERLAPRLIKQMEKSVN